MNQFTFFVFPFMWKILINHVVSVTHFQTNQLYILLNLAWNTCILVARIQQLLLLMTSNNWRQQKIVRFSWNHVYVWDMKTIVQKFVTLWGKLYWEDQKVKNIWFYFFFPHTDTVCWIWNNQLSSSSSRSTPEN